VLSGSALFLTTKERSFGLGLLYGALTSLVGIMLGVLPAIEFVKEGFLGVGKYVGPIYFVIFMLLLLALGFWVLRGVGFGRKPEDRWRN